MKTSIGQSKNGNLTVFHVVWSVPAKVFLTVTFSILCILDIYYLSDIEQDCSHTVFAVVFFTLTTQQLMNEAEYPPYSSYDTKAEIWPKKRTVTGGN